MPTEEPDAGTPSPGTAPLTDADARKIAKQILRELSDNFAEYVGRGVISMALKGLLLLIVVLAVYGWAHMGSLPPAASAHPSGH